MKRFAAALLVMSFLAALCACADYRMPGYPVAPDTGTSEISGTAGEPAATSVTEPETESGAATSSDVTETETASDTVTETEAAPATEAETDAAPVTDKPAESTTKKAESTTSKSGEKPFMTDDGYDYYTDVSKYLDYIKVNDKAHLLLVNKEYTVPSDYVPENLVKITDGKTAYTTSVSIKNETSYLEKYAAMAYLAVMQEMKHFGITGTKGQSCYRSYTLQNNLYTRYFNNEKAAHPKLSDDEVRAIVDTYSAFPGASEHHTGLALDFSPISNSFEKSAAFKFLKENGYKFGFILRYDKNTSDITGYKYEPWHWRFVGREAATYIYEHGITFEEYINIIGDPADYAYHAPVTETTDDLQTQPET